MINIISNDERRRRIEELQRRREQINAYLIEDAEDSVAHGWSLPDHQDYFTELKEIKTELSLLGAE